MDYSNNSSYLDALYINMWEGIVQGNVKIHHPPAGFTTPSLVNPSYSYE